MIEISPQLVVFLVAVGVFTVTAAILDLRIKKIPNKLTLPFFGAGIVYQLAFNQLGNGIGSPGLIDSAAAFAISSAAVRRCRQTCSRASWAWGSIFSRVTVSPRRRPC